jgi:hypothetical protein
MRLLVDWSTLVRGRERGRYTLSKVQVDGREKELANEGAINTHTQEHCHGLV